MKLFCFFIGLFTLVQSFNPNESYFDLYATTSEFMNNNFQYFDMMLNSVDILSKSNFIKPTWQVRFSFIDTTSEPYFSIDKWNIRKAKLEKYFIPYINFGVHQKNMKYRKIQPIYLPVLPTFIPTILYDYIM